MTESTSPFHPGERDIQARLGIEDKMLEPGRLQGDPLGR